jgi:hypothetical protein
MTGPSLNASLPTRPSSPATSGMLGALGRFVYRRRRLVLLAWAILFAVGLVMMFSFNVARTPEPVR